MGYLKKKIKSETCTVTLELKIFETEEEDKVQTSKNHQKLTRIQPDKLRMNPLPVIRGDHFTKNLYLMC